MLYMKVVKNKSSEKILNPKENLFSVSLICVYEMMGVHWASCSNHFTCVSQTIYAVHLKLIQCCMSIISQWNWKKKVKNIHRNHIF